MRNPFYPLSALLMLAGCYTVAGALALEPGRLIGLVGLIATLHVYELLLVSLALVLLRYRRVAADAASLVAIESLFLADASLLLNELLAADLASGIAATIVTLLLAALKLGSLVHGTQTPRGRRVAAWSAQLALVLAAPAVFAIAARRDALTIGSVHLAWWAAAAACLAGWAAARGDGRSGGGGEAAHALVRWLSVVPAASLFVHVYAAAWVYDIPFRAANLAPLLLALGWAAACAPSPTRRLVWLPAAALVLTLAPDPALTSPAWGVMLTPFRAVWVVSALLYLVVFRRWRSVPAAVAAAACAVVAFAGHTPGAVARTFEAWLDLSAPRSAADWGSLLVGLAFATLVLGALRSARRAAE